MCVSFYPFFALALAHRLASLFGEKFFVLTFSNTSSLVCSQPIRKQFRRRRCRKNFMGIVFGVDVVIVVVSPLCDDAHKKLKIDLWNKRRLWDRVFQRTETRSHITMVMMMMTKTATTTAHSVRVLVCARLCTWLCTCRAGRLAWDANDSMLIEFNFK